jgi:hypothetical protein
MLKVHKDVKTNIIFNPKIFFFFLTVFKKVTQPDPEPRITNKIALKC